MAAGKLTLLQRLRKTKIYRGKQMNNALPKRLNWEQIEARPRQEGQNVVKGTSKRIVVVKSPDPRVFEQAIFIVRNDAAGEGVTSRELVEEARRVARSCVSGGSRFSRGRCALSPVVYALMGAGAIGLAWLAAALI